MAFNWLLLHLHRVPMDDTPVQYHPSSRLHLSLRSLMEPHRFHASPGGIFPRHGYSSCVAWYWGSCFLPRRSVPTLFLFQEEGAGLPDESVYLCRAARYFLCWQSCMADHQGWGPRAYRRLEIVVSD